MCMGKKSNNLIKSCLSSSLVILLAGCMSQSNNLKPEGARNHAPALAEKPISISPTHEQTISAGDEQLNLEETLDTEFPEENVALGEDEVHADDEPDNAVDDPTVEDESETSQAIFSAAKDLLTKNAINEEAARSNNIWPRIRAGFSLPDRDHSRVQPDREWFTKNQTYLDRTFTRAAPYLHYIIEEVQARQMPMEIALLPVVESAYQPFAYSRSHAAGIWQFIPGTANAFGLKINWWYDGRRDIHASTNAALTYLQKLHNQFNGDWLLALAAYNSGEGTVGRAIAKNESLGLGTRFWDLDLPQETRSYVPRLLAITDIVDSPEKYGLTIHSIPNQKLLKSVNVGSQLDLAIAADMAGLTLEELYTLNPGFNRWATAPNGPHQLLLPLEKIASFKAKLATLPATQRIKLTRHEIKRGENLGKIAKKYGVSIAAIQRANKLNGSLVRTGQELIIPTSSRANQEYLLTADRRLATKQSSPNGKKKTLYIVRSGDSLWKISTQQKIALNTLAAWNNITPKDTLRQGQKLVIWKEGKQSTTRISQPDRTQKVKYRVRSGDSLARISQKFNVSISDLREWNPTVRSKHIQPGQQLVVFVDITKVADNT